MEIIDYYPGKILVRVLLKKYRHSDKWQENFEKSMIANELIVINRNHFRCLQRDRNGTELLRQEKSLLAVSSCKDPMKKSFKGKKLK